MGKLGESGKTLGKKSLPKTPLILEENEIHARSLRENLEKYPYRCFGKTPRSEKTSGKRAFSTHTKKEGSKIFGKCALVQ
jgi:hypothetical protein